MTSINIRLDSVDKVKDFVTAMSCIDGSTLLHSGRYVVDAKSIMGIFSLDLSKPMILEIEEWKEEYEEKISTFYDTLRTMEL